MKSTSLLSALITVVLTAFAAILLYHIITFYNYGFSGFGIAGLISLLFAFIGYLLYAFIGTNTILRGFIWGYYVFGFGSLFYSVAILRYSISLLLGLLIMFAVSLILIQWRIRSVSTASVKGKAT
jgi:hypothetical protein